MKKLLIALLVTALLLCSTALGEYRPATASPTPPPNGWVRGTITDVANSSTRLSNVTVKADDKVKTGDVLGTVDTINGQVQLHFEIWQGTKPQNPESWLK